MIIDKVVKIKYVGGNVKHLKSIGYDLKYGDEIEIPTNHLSENSHVRINCKCDICESELIMTYQTYNLQTEYNGKCYCKFCMKEKRKLVLNDKYGVDNIFQLESVKKMSDETKMKKYGNPKYRNDDKIKETNLLKYDCINVFQNEEIKDKMRKTNFINSGFEYVMQNPKSFEKSLFSGKKIKYYNDTLYYQGTYEKDFLEFCNKLSILEFITKPKTIEYNFDNKKCYYHPDFYIEKLNLIIEIKSDYWWNKLYNLNIVKENTTKEKGYEYIIVMNKNYDNFKKYVDKLNLVSK